MTREICRGVLGSRLRPCWGPSARLRSNSPPSAFEDENPGVSSTIRRIGFGGLGRCRHRLHQLTGPIGASSIPPVPFAEAIVEHPRTAALCGDLLNR